MNSNSNWVHDLMAMYNGAVVLLIAGFMAITQQKIIDHMGAAAFLKQVPALPMSSGEIMGYSCILFLLFIASGYIYTRSDFLSGVWRYSVFAFEFGICIILMGTMNLAYDGIVLLLVADLMSRYEGTHQLVLLLGAMVLIYLIISYNTSLLHMQVVPFYLYLDYYSASVQSVLMSLKNLVTYGNITFFVLYMVVLIQDKRRENEQIAQLNQQLKDTNNKLNISNNKLHVVNYQMNSANRKLREHALVVANLAETKERNRLAREIHDTLGHALTGIVAGADACMVMIDVAPDMAKKQLSKIRAAAQKGMVDVRRSMHKLRPDDLEKLSLKDALTKMAQEFSDAGTTKVDLKIVNFPQNLREDQSEVIYRILQEGMTNASRHGHALNVGISVVGEGDKLNIMIADDGIGCDDVKAGFGLHHMQERIDLLGGTLKYYNESGFVLEVMLPLNK